MYRSSFNIFFFFVVLSISDACVHIFNQKPTFTSHIFRKIYVWYVRENFDVLANDNELSIKKKFQNFVTID